MKCGRAIFSLALLVGVAVALPWDRDSDQSHSVRGSGTTCNCGWVNRGRIVGGKETRKNEYPLMVALQSNDGFQFCGGSIITPWHVLTAAHCTYGKSPNDILVNVGAHVKGVQSEGVYRLDRIINHEKYDNRLVIFDVSVLVTKNEIRFNQNVGPVCLPTQRLNIAGQRIKAIGWGRTKDGGRPSTVLQEVDLQVIPFKQCAAGWPTGITRPREDCNMCTFEVRKDTCQGDSGGPLLWLDPATQRYTQAALVSYGGECGGGQPAPNTDVSAFIPWINKQIQSTKPGVRACTRV